MIHDPRDFNVSGYPRYGNWGSITGYTICVVHIPTNISVTRTGERQHATINDAYLELFKILETETDTFNQTELF